MPRRIDFAVGKIRSTVLEMLAEAGGATPSTSIDFRQVISVRKLRARLGGGDPATLTRALNVIEAEVVRSGLADAVIPGIPPDIAELMRGLWETVVAAQLDDVLRVRASAEQAIAAANSARSDAEHRVKRLRQDVSELCSAVTDRNTDLANLREEHAKLKCHCTSLETTITCQLCKLHSEVVRRMALEHMQGETLAMVQRYEALSKKLLQVAADQRKLLKREHEQFTSDLKIAKRRIAALDVERVSLRGELMREQEARRQAMKEACTWETDNANLQVRLSNLVHAVSALEASRRKATVRPRLANATRRWSALKTSTASRRE